MEMEGAGVVGDDLSDGHKPYKSKFVESQSIPHNTTNIAQLEPTLKKKSNKINPNKRNYLKR